MGADSRGSGGWEELIASRNVELNMTESEFTTWMEQNCPPEYAPIPPPPGRRFQATPQRRTSLSKLEKYETLV